MTNEDVDWAAFYKPLQQFVARRVQHAPDVDDLVQLILERAMSKADGQVENAAHWLFGIARNAVADHYRHQARKLERVADELEATPVLGETDSERSEVIACMEPLLRALSPAESQLLRWADMQGRSMQSIADELGISLTAAKSRVQRARKEFMRVTRHCCAITMDARGRVTELSPRTAEQAIACASGCAGAPASGRTTGGSCHE